MNRVICLATALVVLSVIGLGASFVDDSGFGQSSAAQTSSESIESAAAAGNAATGGGKTNASAPQPHRVGRQVCRECHSENYALHAQHGHASTLFRVEQTEIPALLQGTTFDAGEAYGTYAYQADQQQRLTVTLPSRFGEEPFPLEYALGSGRHAQTMLTLAPGLDGETIGIEHRVSCYPGDRIGLTPGHEGKQPTEALEFFGAASGGEPLQRCIYCHSTSGRIVKEQIVNLVPNVNCEKCHGPGSEHVRQARANPDPPPFSVGRETWDSESEIQLCGDCHRLPRNVSEKEIREYPDLLARFQPIGMLRSRCYLGSGRELRCTTCHQPHTTLNASEQGRQVEHCVSCHDQSHSDHVVCPVSPKTGCIECHMPAIELEQGLTFHDHWIRVHDE